MDFPGFLKIEKRQKLQSEVFVAHQEEPRFSMEIGVETAADGKRLQGAIKRVFIPNSANGNYHLYSGPMEMGERFLEAALESEGVAISRG